MVARALRVLGFVNLQELHRLVQIPAVPLNQPAVSEAGRINAFLNKAIELCPGDADVQGCHFHVQNAGPEAQFADPVGQAHRQAPHAFSPAEAPFGALS